MANHTVEAISETAPLPDIKVRKPSLLRVMRKYWAFYLMLLPAALVLLINNYIPMVGIIIAFLDVEYPLKNSSWSGFQNFEYLFLTKDAFIAARNTLLYNAGFILMNLIFPLAFALMLNEMKNRFMAKFHQTIMFLPYFLSYIVISYLVFGFLNPEQGFLNKTVFPALGIEPINWYFEQKVWPWILSIVNTWKGMGYYTVIYMAAIIGIDDELYEAATIDGANKWQQMSKITIPLLAPIISILTLLQVGRIFNADFGLFYQVPRESGILFPVTNVIDTYVYRTFLTVGDIGLSSAAGMLQSIGAFVLVFFSNWIVRRFNRENALF